MNALETIIAKMDDYALEHQGRYPKRVTVSVEVARELDAISAFRNSSWNLPPNADDPPARLRNGGVFFIRGVQVVVDVDDDEIVDHR